MSGGHFDYQESYLGYIAEQLEQDIEFNDVEDDVSRQIDIPYGFQHQPETIAYLKIMIQDLRRLGELLHDYDYAVSGDSSIESFLEKARAAFKYSEEEKC